LRALGPQFHEARALERVLYLSTVGVYGDHEGGWVDEESPLRPVSQRSLQRVAAERAWQAFADGRNIDLGIFRLSGIYGPGRSAIDNLKAGTARRIIKPGQVFNRIHVDDIAGALCAAIRNPGRLDVFNLTDHEPAPPQDVVEFAAMLLRLPIPAAIPFEEAQLSEMGRSFYGENKRVANGLIRSALGYTFRCPTYREGLKACLPPA
jgi:nucleoside-diphosphate-sugar epimerase